MVSMPLPACRKFTLMDKVTALERKPTLETGALAIAVSSSAISTPPWAESNRLVNSGHIGMRKRASPNTV